MAQSYTRRIHLWINGVQVRSDIKSIQARMMHLQRTIKTLEIGSRQYNAEMAKIRHLNGVIAQHNAQLKVTQVNLTSIKGLANAFNKFWPMIMGTIGAFAGLAFGVRRATTDFAEFDDKIADVMKVTGLTRDQVIELNNELKKMDTRTAQESLIELAWVAGKLGISATEDILGFVRAADQISVALAKDLGGSAEEAIRMIGKMAEVFEVRQVYGIEEAMLRLGSAINELGMASTAQEGFLIQFASRVGGIAPTAGVSAQDILGLAATLDILGQKAEVSATAYSRVMTTMARDTEIMARLSGVSIADYRKLFEEDANEAMLRLFEAIGGVDGGFEALITQLGEAGLEGQRLTQVLGVLVRNVESLRVQQELANKAFDDGTSITNEFNIKNNTAQAILEKKQKALGNLRKELGERLLPVYMGVLSYQERFMKSLVTIIEWVYENRGALITLIATIVTYRITIYTLTKAYHTQIILGKTLTALNLQLIRGYNLLTGNITRAAAAQRMFNRISFANPWIAIVAGITAAGVAIWQYRKRIRDAAYDISKVYKEAEADYTQQAANIQRLIGIIEDERLANDLRIEAIKELKEIMPNYNGMLNEEGELIGHNTKAIGEYLEALRAKLRAKALEEEITSLIQQQFEAQDRLSKAEEKYHKAQKYYDDFHNRAPGMHRRSQTFGDLSEDKYRQAKKELDAAIKSYNNIAKAIEELTDIRAEPPDLSFEEQLRRELKLLEEAVKAFEPGKLWEPFGKEGIMLLDQFIPIEEARQRIEELRELLISGAGDPIVRSDMYSAENEMRAKQALQQDLLHSRLLRGYEEYQEKLKDLELRFMKGRHSQLDKDGEDWLKMRGQIYDKEIDLLRQKISREEELTKTATIQDPIATEALAYEQRLRNLQLFHKEFEDMTELEQSATLSLREQYQAKLDKIDADAIKNEIERKQKAHDMALAAMKIHHQQQLEEGVSFEQAKALLAEFMDEQELSRIRTLGQAKTALQKHHAHIEEQTLINHLNSMRHMLETLMDTGEWDGIITADQIFSDEELQVVLDALTKVYDALAKLGVVGDGDGIEKNQLRGLEVDIFGFRQEDWDKMFENLKKGQAGVEEIQMAALALSNVWYDVNRIISNSEQKKLDQFRENNQQQQDWLQERFDAGLMSHEYFVNQQARLEADLDKRRAIHARDQARRERNVALMQAIVNTAAAIVKSLPNIALAAIVAAAGGLQIGIIASTPLPQIPGAETGGYLDVVRSQDRKRFRGKYQPGKRGWVHEPTIITGEAGSEYVIPGEGINNPKLRPIIDMIEMARLNGNLPTLDPDVSRIMSKQMPGRQRGGSFQQSTSDNLSHDGTILHPSDTLDKITKALDDNNHIMKQLYDRLKHPITANVSMLGNDGIKEKEREYKQLMKNAYN